MHFQEMADRSAVGSFIFNLSTGRFIYANQAMILLLNTDMQNLTPDLIEKFIHPEDHEYAVKAFDDLANDLSNHIQLRIVLDEEVKWIRVMASLTTEGEGDKLIYGNAIDTTLTMDSQYVLEKYANKKDAILNILSHDLMGPLSVTNMLGSSLKSLNMDPTGIKMIDSILKINQEALELIAQLTKREFLETADVKLAKKRINVSKKLREYIEEYQRSSAETQRSYYFSTSPDDIFLEVDEPKLIQVINNLIKNSLKFTKENGQITLSIQDRNDVVFFEVKDNGIGIPEEYHDVLFDKFTDASRQGLQGEPSIGLGMYVIKNIIEWHNGTVWVESKNNEGTAVCFTLPKQ